MLKTRNIVLIGALVISLVSIGFSLWVYQSSPKVAFINSSELIDKYMGIKDVLKIHDVKVLEWQANIDTLYNSYQVAMSKLENPSKRLSSIEIEKIELEIEYKKEKFLRYKEESERIALQEKEKMLQGALNQVNSYIEEYAKQNHIDLVIGVTLSGNVLYGSNKLDITNEIIEGLNKSYRK